MVSIGRSPNHVANAVDASEQEHLRPIMADRPREQLSRGHLVFQEQLICRHGPLEIHFIEWLDFG
jgi:hypothetical protein